MIAGLAQNKLKISDEVKNSTGSFYSSITIASFIIYLVLRKNLKFKNFFLIYFI